MTQKNQSMNQLMAMGLMILAAAFSRFIPHPWNFTAVGAMALFGGAYLPKRLSLMIPLAALMVTDAILGFHNTMIFVYAAFAAIVVLGWVLRSQRSAIKVGGMSLLASVLFFAVSNFGVWMMDGMYARTFEGLVQCYVAAIPFFGNQVAGDLFFSAVMFGGYEVAKSLAPNFLGHHS